MSSLDWKSSNYKPIIQSRPGTTHEGALLFNEFSFYSRCTSRIWQNGPSLWCFCFLFLRMLTFTRLVFQIKTLYFCCKCPGVLSQNCSHLPSTFLFCFLLLSTLLSVISMLLAPFLLLQSEILLCVIQKLLEVLLMQIVAVLHTMIRMVSIAFAIWFTMQKISPIFPAK